MTQRSPPNRPWRRRRGGALSATTMTAIGALAVVLVVSAAREISDNSNLTSSGTFGVMVRTAAPVALAGLAGLFAERSGTVNIGLEGMMIMGTIFAGWWGWELGPWMAIVGGIIGGALGGLLHALATATFGVNHIVSGFAINIIAPGVARFMAGLLFVDDAGVSIDGGSISNSPNVSSSIGRFTLPLLSGGDLFGWTTPDPLGWLEDKQWFAVSDVAGFLKGLTTRPQPGHHPRPPACSWPAPTCCGGRPSACACGRPASARAPPTPSACRCCATATTAWRSPAGWPASVVP